jgi:glycosyltransferase involved in cell wall biosynthesis
VQIHVLSFEGPDPYCYAGGIASRITGLTESLADLGFDTHLWFVGDATLPGYEERGALKLHRWCQWISRFHPGGVYDGEEGKRLDYASSLPPSLMEKLLPHLAQGGFAMVMAEEWQTADAVLHLDWLLRGAGLRDQVAILWNANNTFGFDRIDWPKMTEASTVTTVSRYMKHRMRECGVDALVIPNGVTADAFIPPHPEAVAALRRRFADRLLLTKVARWDPDKRWMMAIGIVARLKQEGWQPLLVARGGIEPYGGEVLWAAACAGLRVVERPSGKGVSGMLEALSELRDADIVVLRSPVDPQARGMLFQGAAAVLANSAHEPFGLVGLETMAAGGLACTGISGEDYAMPGRNALVLQTTDPDEFLTLFGPLRTSPDLDSAMRRAGRITAEQYRWPDIIQSNILPRVSHCFGADSPANQRREFAAAS